MRKVFHVFQVNGGNPLNLTFSSNRIFLSIFKGGNFTKNSEDFKYRAKVFKLVAALKTMHSSHQIVYHGSALFYEISN